MDAWATLGLECGASDEDVKKAYRRLAMQFHPDRAGTGSTAKFQEIQKAYDAITSGKASRTSSGTYGKDHWYYDHAPDPAWKDSDRRKAFYEDIMREMHRARKAEDDSRNSYRDEDMFWWENEDRSEYEYRYGKDRDGTTVNLEANITPTSLWFGAAFSCNVNYVNKYGEHKSERIEFTVRPGSDPQTIIRVKSAIRPGVTYRIKFAVNYSSHPMAWTRDGNDLHYAMEIDYVTLMVGGAFTFKHINGKTYSVNIPKKIDSTTNIKLSRLGVQDPVVTDEIGDLYIEIIPVPPKTVSAELMKALQKEQECQHKTAKN